MRQFAFNLADLVTLIVFMVLGANIPFSELGDNLLPALAVLATLMLVARPIVVFACTMPDRERAVDPAGARVPVLDARDGGGAGRAGGRAGRPRRAGRRRVRVSVVALAIVLTLLLQALPARWLAGRLGLLERQAEPSLVSS